MQLLVAAKQYEVLLADFIGGTGQATGTLAWKLMWQEALIKTKPGAEGYVFVPVRPQLPSQPYALQTVGEKRYLRFKRTYSGWECSLLSFFYRAPQNKLRGSAATPGMPGFLKTYSGDVLIGYLGTGRVVLYKYKNGSREHTYGNGGTSLRPGQRTLTGNTASSPQGTTQCVEYRACSWLLTCPRPYSFPEFQIVHNDGEGTCIEPWGTTLSCGTETVYHLGAWNTYRLCDGGEGDGDGDGDGGDDNGDIDPDDDNNPPLPPCEGMNAQNQIPAFKAAQNELIAKTSGNAEYSYAFNDKHDFSTYVGTPGIPGKPVVSMIYDKSIPLDGISHNHYVECLDVHSGGDLKAMFDIMKDGHMRDDKAFTSSLFTQNGVDYSIMITNYNQFLNFGSIWLHDVDAVISLENLYYYDRPGGIGYKNSAVSASEKAFLSMLDQNGAGITILKHDRAADTWTTLSVNDQNEVVSTPCL
ncbi:hypothetical protein [Hymenobacter elongatus]|uniref:Uncharacterized protein n=1 Tax=Hymenobacter elongatus TaxID=877208 RepID=A0A4Z0PGW9_9BACT|nr:hypothetical protein [Hymenobacter elongatus]TGE14386.1 hypothetical protein E5J99_16185 [Hymenobacter elongatus]